MRRLLACLLPMALAIAILGCNRSSPPTSDATAAPPATFAADAERPDSASPTPHVAIAPLDTGQTITPAPPTATAAVSLPYPQQYNADGTLNAVTPIPAAPQVICAPQGEVIGCFDELLDMTFSYPEFMGPIVYTTLNRGSSGYGYEYSFEESESYAGGRSNDFGAQRGPRYTDQRGFDGQDAAAMCARWRAAICQELSPGALLIVMLPQAEWICSDAMLFTPIPRAILALDLPQHPLIQGFSFSAQLMSAETAAQFRARWYNEKQCAPETEVEFGTAMEQLRENLLAGTAEVEIQRRYDMMAEIAGSIQSPFFCCGS